MFVDWNIIIGIRSLNRVFFLHRVTSAVQRQSTEIDTRILHVRLFVNYIFMLFFCFHYFNGNVVVIVVELVHNMGHTNHTVFSTNSVCDLIANVFG